jgi:hypothetical protein
MRAIKDIAEDYAKACMELGDLVIKREALGEKIKEAKRSIATIEKEYAKAQAPVAAKIPIEPPKDTGGTT